MQLSSQFIYQLAIAMNVYSSFDNCMLNGNAQYLRLLQASCSAFLQTAECFSLTSVRSVTAMKVWNIFSHSASVCPSS